NPFERSPVGKWRSRLIPVLTTTREIVPGPLEITHSVSCGPLNRAGAMSHPAGTANASVVFTRCSYETPLSGALTTDRALAQEPRRMAAIAAFIANRIVESTSEHAAAEIVSC